jgi:hypothetical protein
VGVAMLIALSIALAAQFVGNIRRDHDRTSAGIGDRSRTFAFI